MSTHAVLSSLPALSFPNGSPTAQLAARRRRRRRAALGTCACLTLAACAQGRGPEGSSGAATQGGDALAQPGDDGGADSSGIADVPLPKCEPWLVEHVPGPSATALMFVLDKSGSMRERWDHDGDPSTAEVSRWWSLRHAMGRWVDAYGSRLTAGVQLFPRRGATSTVAEGCEMSPSPEIALGALDAAALTELPDADENMYGASPATLGIRQALDDLSQSSAQRARAMVLITDGAANCREGSEGADRFNRHDELLAEEVERAFVKSSIPTYVVGIDIIDGTWTGPDVNPHVALSAVARAGGVPRTGAVPYYEVDGPGELEPVLDAITNSVSCGVSVGELDAEGELVVRDDTGVVPEVPGCLDGLGQAASRGWTWTVDGGLELCAGTCGAAASVEQRCPGS